MGGVGNWTDQSRSYLPRKQSGCQASGLPMDQLFSIMLDSGLEVKDIEYLEYLSDPKVLSELGVTKLIFNQRKDLILYLKAWANLLERELLKSVPLNAIKQQLIQNVTTP